MRSRFRLGLIAALPALTGGIAHAQPTVFDNPRSVCQALAGEGFRVGQWRDDDEGFEDTQFNAYKCYSDPMIISGGDSVSFITSLNYFAEGRTKDRVEIVKLVLNVHNRKTRDAGRAKFAAASKALLQALGIAPPQGLVAALDANHGADFPIAAGRIRFEVWTVPVERERLTIESNSTLRR